MQINPGNLHALCLWLLHVTSPRDSCKWYLYNSTQFAELSQLNNSLRFCWKQNFFGVPKIRSVSTWHITWLFPFTLNIAFDQPSILLGWLFYNSKSFKPNGSASPFRRKNKRLLVTSLEFFILPVQWPDLMLANVFVKTPHRLSAATMSILSISPIEVHKEPFLMTVVLALKPIFKVSKSFNW